MLALKGALLGLVCHAKDSKRRGARKQVKQAGSEPKASQGIHGYKLKHIVEAKQGSQEQAKERKAFFNVYHPKGFGKRRSEKACETSQTQAKDATQTR